MIQWNLQIKDTLGPAIFISFIERFGGPTCITEDCKLVVRLQNANTKYKTKCSSKENTE